VVAAGAAVSLAGVASADLVPTALPAGTDIGSYSIDLGSSGQRGDVTVYENLATSGFFFPLSSAGAAYGDDLHMTSGGDVSSVSFGYFTPGLAAFDATISLYANDPADSVIPTASPLLGSFTVTLDPGAFIVTVALGTTIAAGSDIWLNYDATDAESGLFISGAPATIGASDDLFEIDDTGLFFFGGDPIANYTLAVGIVPAPGSLALLGLGGLFAIRRRR